MDWLMLSRSSSYCELSESVVGDAVCNCSKSEEETGLAFGYQGLAAECLFLCRESATIVSGTPITTPST